MPVLTPDPSSPALGGAPNNATTRSALVVIMLLYLFWGSITSLNDILIPHLKGIFALNYTQAMFLQFFFFSAYAVFAYPSSKVVEWIGYKTTIIAGLAVVGFGALLFVPAAAVASFAFFLFGASVLAAGMTFMQVSANPYVSILGAPETAAARLNMAGVFNSLGTTVAPYIGSILILHALPVGTVLTPAMRIQEASTVKLPYIVIACALFLFAVLLSIFKLPPITAYDATLAEPIPENSTIWQHRHLLLGFVGIFMYVGVEVGVGSLLTSYVSLPDIGHLPIQAAAKYLSVYWGGLLVGRVAGATVLRKIPAHLSLSVAGVCSLVLILLSMATHGPLAMWCLLLTGLFHSIMWPCIFTLAIKHLGPLTSRGSGLLISGIIGGALLPLAQGFLADHIGLHRSFIIVAVAYVYIAFYGFAGYKPNREAVAA